MSFKGGLLKLFPSHHHAGRLRNMDAQIKKKIIQTTAGIVVAVALFLSSGMQIPVADQKADEYFGAAITKAGLAYATCRAINASVSIVQNSSLQLEPAGVGVSLAVGQALDPINDMTERLSDVLVTAITSLGVQKLVYEIGVSLVPQVMAVCLVVLSLLLWLENFRIRALQAMVIKIVLFLAVFRFCLPLSSVVNTFVYENFFHFQISEAREELALGSAQLETMKEFSLPQVDGILGTIENSASFLKQKSVELKNAIALTVNDIGRIIESLLSLTFLYVGIFLIQIIILPLLSFWLLARTANLIFLTPADKT